MSAARDDGGLDRLSYELGRNAEGLKGLNELFEQHCTDDDRRHEENVKLLSKIEAAQQSSADAIKKLAEAIEARTAVTGDGPFFTRKQIAMLAVIGTSVMVMVGWIVEAGFKWAIAKLLAAKFGGP